MILTGHDMTLTIFQSCATLVPSVL